MARRNPQAQDEAASFVEGSFTGLGFSESEAFRPGGINISVWGTFTGTVTVERSFDGGTVWIPLSTDLIGGLLSFTSQRSLIAEEVERNVLYRMSCTAFTAGPINFRMSQG